MMNKLAKFLQKFAMDYVVKYLKNNKADVIKTANAKVNLPILNEKLEVIKDDKPEIEITEEILEEHNYIVFTFDNTLDWNVIKEVFEIKEVNKLNRHLGDKGLGRIINGTRLLNKLNEL